MSQSAEPAQFEEEDGAQRPYGHPRSGKKQIPTISKFRAERRELQGQMRETEEAQEGPEDESRPKRAYGSVKAIFKEEDEGARTDHDPYPVSNHHYQDNQAKRGDKTGEDDRELSEVEEDDEDDNAATQSNNQQQRQQQQQGQRDDNKDGNQQQEQTATEAVIGTLDPKEKRKAMKKTKRHGGGRQVTDPVTHLPIVIHDQTVCPPTTNSRLLWADLIDIGKRYEACSRKYGRAGILS